MPPEKLSHFKEWLPGTIVTLQTHAYTSKIFGDAVMIGGDSSLLSPVMVIIEVLIEGKSHFEEHSGMEIAQEGSFQCKCMWFSSKSHHFEDVWISSRLLKPIKKIEDLLPEGLKTSYSYGDKVNFRTVAYELDKRKSTLKHNSHSSDPITKDISSLVSFVAPLMQVVGTSRYESKEPLIDNKSGAIRRVTTNRLIKCKYFNCHSDKFSEVFLPIETLEFINIPDDKTLKFLNNSLNKKQYLVFSENPENVESRTLLEPKLLHFRNGIYFLEALDKLTYQRTEIRISANENRFKPYSRKNPSLPSFSENNGKFLTKFITPDTLKELIGKPVENEYLNITYTDHNENTSVRTLKEYSIIEPSEEEKNDTDLYLKAKCLLRDSIRYFKISRIKKAQLFDLNDDL
ncbi:hypothetical protein BWI93_23770 [Siphonobacter sp. BAB-5385]|uniref:WYL domain-containing protein n=1 Tax=Siphonobacter sp. BAB-5385 TaxID=1864822 RepID=UPI000B9E828F|nr:hypothetical protein [Siphonobacter sp. BAB-5385]OZI05711.1 hypothetical protein BWI93_23770 [Siphonobacter sp. BAB-5385]